ncbi:heme oxygenase [Dunaliella salina]|uniref:Heme oxygenase n=1 Tax=Dunaliella salina TaxID=3046 RepID=A0ABQ7GYW5_DUNSA|nr:heme oxygenase [Dunaliella salina]|eukprot:KAF5839797.1 heme oxygenase [Dunaliella salina]
MVVESKEPPSPQPPTLTEDLRKTSKTAHGISDALTNARIIVVFTDRELYGRAISCFMHIFSCIEELLPGALESRKELAPFKDVLRESALFRAEAYKQDLQFYLGPDWQARVTPTPEVASYLQYLRGLKSQPLLLLTHAYTQYLAMASGGQIIARMARRQMQLPQEHGTKAFEFGPAVNASELKLGLKCRMDSLGEVLSDDERQQILREHLKVFSYNNAIIGSFPIGWWASARGFVLLVPPMTRYTLLLLAVAVPAFWLANKKA